MGDLKNFLAQKHSQLMEKDSMSSNTNKFRSFKNSNYQFSPVSWELVYNFQKTENNFPFQDSQDSKCMSIYIWGSSGFDERNQSIYGGMYAYAEVVDAASGQMWFESFFGETSENDAFRWATDKAMKQLIQ